MSGTEQGAEQEETISYNLNPGDEFELNVFLDKLAKEMNTDDFQSLKYYMRGTIGKGVLERMEKPHDLFDHLRQIEFLSVGNILGLQAMIWHIDRKDLYRKMVEFGRRLKKPLHFHAPKESPENGFKYVKFHVSGKVNQSKVETVRSEVARLLFVPPEFVVVAGLEASNSLLITLMIPEDCIIVLSDFTDTEKLILKDLSIDYFFLDGQRHIIEAGITPEDDNEELQAMRKLLQKKKDMQKQLDSCNSELVLCRKKIKELQGLSDSNQQKIAEIESFANMRIATQFYNMYLLKQINEKKVVPALFRSAGARLFTILMEETRKLGYDRSLIDKLLETNSLITKANITKAYRMLIEQLQWEIDFANASIDHLQYTNQYLSQRLAFTMGQRVDDTTNQFQSDEFLQFIAMQKALPVIQFAANQEIVLQLTDEETKECLYQLAKELTPKERYEIRKPYRLNESELEMYRKDPYTLFQIVMAKLRTSGPLNIGSFVQQQLKVAKRPELKAKFEQQIIAKFMKQRDVGTAHSGTDLLETISGGRFGQSVKKQTRTTSPSPRKRNDSESDKLSDLNFKVQKMEKMMEQMMTKLEFNSFNQLQSRSPYFDDPKHIKMAANLYFKNRYSSNTGKLSNL